MTYREMRQIVADNTSTTQTAQAFRKAFGLPQCQPKHRENYKRLMSQRIGALDRVK